MDPELKTFLENKFAEVESKFTEVRQEIERVETALLTEFHKWASPLEMRMRSHSAAMRAFDAELEAIDDRVKRLEGNT